MARISSLVFSGGGGDGAAGGGDFDGEAATSVASRMNISVDELELGEGKSGLCV